MRPVWSHRTKITAEAVTFSVLARTFLFVLVIAAALPLARVASAAYVRGGLTSGRANAQPGPYAELRVANASDAEAERIRSAMASLRYHVDPAAVSVVVNDEQPSGRRPAGEYDSTGRIVLSRPVVDLGGATLTWTLGHELGHHVDLNAMDESSRAEFRALRGIPPGLGWEAPLRPWDERPAEDFADMFAGLSQRPESMKTTTVYGPIEDPAKLEALLAARGVVPGQQLASESPAETWARDAGLYKEFLERPEVLNVLLFAAAAFIGWGAVFRGDRVWMTGARR